MQGFNIDDIQTFCEMVYGVNRDQLYLVDYGYPVDITELAPLAQLTRIINLSANGDFIALGLAHYCTAAAQALTVGTKFAPNVSVLMTDSSSGDPLTQAAAPLELWSENALGRVFFPFPRLFQGRGAINVQITNLDTTTTYTDFQLFLHGVLVRAWSPAMMSKQVTG